MMKNFETPKIEVIMFADINPKSIGTDYLSEGGIILQSDENGMQIEF